MVFTSPGDISVTKWKDKRDVHVISNSHVATMMDSVIRCGKSKRKSIVQIYSSHMLGIYLSDQILSYHSALQKTVRWYKKVGIYIIEISLGNAYYIYNKNTTKNEKHEKFLRINSNKLDWSSFSNTTNSTKEKCCQSMQTLLQEVKALGNEISMFFLYQ